MEIVKENLTIEVVPFLDALKSITGINNKLYDSITNKLILDVVEGWTKETELDNLITEHDLSNFVFIESSNVVNFSAKELKRKIKKESSLKSKLVQFSYNSSDEKINFKFKIPFGQTEIDLLDSIIDTLTGVDALTERMSLYDKRKADGWNLYNEQRSSIVLAIDAGLLTPEQEDFIQTKIKEVVFYLNIADWKTAEKRIIETIVEGAYTQEVKDNFTNLISTYISENYTD